MFKTQSYQFVAPPTGRVCVCVSPVCVVVYLFIFLEPRFKEDFVQKMIIFKVLIIILNCIFNRSKLKHCDSLMFSFRSESRCWSMLVFQFIC